MNLFSEIDDTGNELIMTKRIMTKRQRKNLDRLRQLVADFQPYIPYVHNGTLIEIFNYIATVLYGVLVDCPENEELNYNLEQIETSLQEFEKLLKHEKSIG